MANYTLTYSEELLGWTSFHSYYPDWMAGLNNDFYTFKNGKVWKHNVNSTRNNYYGTQYSSEVETVFNIQPDQPKMFKTIKLKGKSVEPWSAVAISDLADGVISINGYEKKEGNWYGYVRRTDGDLDPTYLSVQGLGIVATASTAADTVTITISGNVTQGVSVKTQSPPQDNGDLLFSGVISGSTITTLGPKLGQVKTISYDSGTNTTTIEMVNHPYTGVAPTAPVVGTYLISAKSSVAESYGLRGAYMKVRLTNSETINVELLSVGSEIFKSYQ